MTYIIVQRIWRPTGVFVDVEAASLRKKTTRWWIICGHQVTPTGPANANQLATYVIFGFWLILLDFIYVDWHWRSTVCGLDHRGALPKHCSTPFGLTSWKSPCVCSMSKRAKQKFLNFFTWCLSPSGFVSFYDTSRDISMAKAFVILLLGRKVDDITLPVYGCRKKIQFIRRHLKERRRDTDLYDPIFK